MPPEAIALRSFLTRVGRRLTWISAAEGAAAGLAAALVVAVVLGPSAISRSLVIAGGLVAVGMVSRIIIARRGPSVAQRIERRAPQSRNLVLTASELESGLIAAEPVAPLVYAHAARFIGALNPAELFPARRAIAALVAAAGLWTVAVTRTAAGHPVLPVGVVRETVVSISGIEATIIPPAYAGRPVESLHDPSRIEALAGSRVKLTLRATADRLVVETLNARDTLASSSRSFSTEFAADADGYVAVQPSLGAIEGTRRLIGVTVKPDEAPRTRITLPGKDVLFDDPSHTIDIAVDARDDLGLASLKLRYTKVAGTGERFTFVEGDIPLQLTRSSDTLWTARARWSLGPLGLEPGDMVVYRSIATDRRPGAAPSESDAFIVEILAPGGNAAAGFEVDPEQERYAVSQQMVILKTERLLARKASMTPETYEVESREIGGEQRKVRAEFVFMMGGELEDAPDPDADLTILNEEAEAAGEDDLLSGRAANQGQVALRRAIRAMSHASSALTNVDLTTALQHEKEALKQLEAAFSRSRILLRALTQRERLDFTRRLTGKLDEAARDRRPMPEPELDSKTVSLRRSLAAIAELAGNATLDAAAAGRLSSVAESVLRVDPSAAALHEVAAILDSVATALTRGRVEEARSQLDKAATGIASVLSESVLVAPSRVPTLDRGRMSGALRDALRGVPEPR